MLDRRTSPPTATAIQVIGVEKSRPSVLGSISSVQAIAAPATVAPT